MQPVAVQQATLAELRDGSRVDGLYACSRKERRTAATGTPFLALELRDRTMSMKAKAFRKADYLAGLFESGDVVHVVGSVETYAGDLQMTVESIRRARDDEVEPTDFLPAAYREVDELDGFLEHLAADVHDPDLERLLDAFLSDEQLRAALRRAPCTRAGHHAYMGGLLEHTVAVATLAREAQDLHRRLNSDILITAAILHDIGKTREFTYGADFGLTDEGILLGHLALGQQLVTDKVAGLGAFPARKLSELHHCILGHHGPQSLPDRRFHTPEALALYRLNALDASIKGALEQGLH